MSRTKSFDPDRVLETTMNVFWRLGYQNTSIDVLMQHTGIARQSLYDTFGDKRSLYLKSLLFYRETTNASLRKLFRSKQPVKKGFRKLLFSLSAESREQHIRGCLLLSANLERDSEDALIADLLRENQKTVEAIFADALRRAQAGGELSRKQDPVALARFFVVTVQGMRAMARLKSDRKALEDVARVALTIFN